jgi:HupE / UreJ protein
VKRAVVAAALLAALVPAACLAHDQTLSQSTWQIDGRKASVKVQMNAIDLTRLPAELTGAEAFGGYLSSHLRLRAGKTNCRVAQPPQPMPSGKAQVEYTWQLQCPDKGALAIESDLLLDVAPSHLHLAHVRLGSAPPRERLLTEAAPSWTIAAEPGSSSLLRCLRLGLGNALDGWDHLACLAALLVVGASLGAALRVVVSFSLACSIALAVATFVQTQPATVPLQALIGLSVAWVGAENLWLRGGRDKLTPWLLAVSLGALAAAAAAGRGRVPALTLGGVALFTWSYFELARRSPYLVSARTALAFLLGALHGFGFAAALGATDLSALPLGRAVLGFNAGAEIGLLAAAASVWLLVRAAARLRPAASAALVDFGSAAALAGGVFWFATRAFA